MKVSPRGWSRWRGSVGTRILAGFGLASLVALLVGAIALAYLQLTNDRLSLTAETARQVSVESLNLKLVAERHGEDIQSFLLSGDMRFLDAARQTRSDFLNLLGRLEEAVADDQGAALLAEVREVHQGYAEAAEAEVALYQQGWPRSAVFLWQSEGQSSKTRLMRAIDGYVEWHGQQTVADIGAARQAGQTAFIGTIVLVLLAAAGSLYLGLEITRGITRRVGALAAAADAIKAGDLDREIRVAGRDEIAILGEAMAQMSRNLRESRDRLLEALDRTARRNRELSSLRDVTESISSNLDLDLLLQRVIESAVTLLEASGGSIALADESGRRFTISAIYQMAPALLGVKLAEGQGLSGQVLARQGPVVVNRYAELPDPLDVGGLRELTSCLAVPIWWEGQVIGVFVLVSTSPERRFGDSDVEVLGLLAKHAAVAIRNARLYEQTRELAVTEERNRLAREIHDTLAQGLTGIALQLELADAVLEHDQGRARRAVLRALELARENLEEARRSVLDLRAAPLEGLTLAEALRELVERVGGEAGLQTRVDLPEDRERFPARLEAGLYRIAQEALTNVKKHADATGVHLSLTMETGQLLLSIEDDGVGMDPDAPRAPGNERGGFGLGSIQERALLLGGTLAISSAEGQGTRIEVAVPLHATTRPARALS